MLCDDPALFSQVARKFNVTQVILPSGDFPVVFQINKMAISSSMNGICSIRWTSVLFVMKTTCRPVRISICPTQNSLRIVIDDINRQWEHSGFLFRREAFRPFHRSCQYLGLSGSEIYSKPIKPKEFLKGL